ncbi:MAG TPA: phosphoribulokinase [Solirubrobacteraceae bacterium]|nr:phosphoribulokinase [Solirubrobacteraceae bacterium]
MPRPILLGIVGDSAAGKTTLTRGLVRILGEDQVTHVSADHYHRYDRLQRAAHGVTPLHPDCNHLEILAQHLGHLRAGDAILKPVYRHQDGTFGAAEYVRPSRFTIVEGLLAFHTPAMRDRFDVRVFLAPPEEMRRKWKVLRDCSRRGYTTDQVLDELDRREADAETYIRPQRHYSDMIISFMPGDQGDAEHLDALVRMRSGLVHPELSQLVGDGAEGISLCTRGSEVSLWVPGTISPQQSERIQESVWDRMHFASHLRTERLGEFTVGTELHRSEPLAIVQLLVLYQLATARAAIAIGAAGARTDGPLTVEDADAPSPAGLA